MIAVLDASAAVRITGDGRTFLKGAAGEADLLISPDLFIAETCNAFRKYAKAKILTYDKAAALTREAIQLVDRFHPLYDLVDDVMTLAPKVPSSVYDLFYLALARRTGAQLLTADQSLGRIAKDLGLRVSAIEELQ